VSPGDITVPDDIVIYANFLFRQAQVSLSEAISLAGDPGPVLTNLVISPADSEGQSLFPASATVYPGSARHQVEPRIHGGNHEMHSPAEARLRITCHQLAADIAEAAMHLPGEPS